jgi:nucleotide-binding universal stress UspA family protein
MPIVAAQLEEDARLALERGTAEATPAHPAETRLVRGDPRYCLLAEVERERATLLVVGSHGQARATGIALGAVATHMLHEAPCPVLVARGTIDPESWPRSIVVGIDGSAESAAAYEAAEALHQRLGGSLRVMVATDSDADVVAARRIAPDVEEHPARPMDMLSVASEGADLLVVGSRGLRGLRSLGSVSERIGHEAKCSVLVVRGGAD